MLRAVRRWCGGLMLLGLMASVGLAPATILVWASLDRASLTALLEEGGDARSAVTHAYLVIGLAFSALWLVLGTASIARERDRRGAARCAGWWYARSALALAALWGVGSLGVAVAGATGVEVPLEASFITEGLSRAVLLAGALLAMAAAVAALVAAALRARDERRGA